MNGQKVWSGVLSGIKSQVSQSAFRTWFSGSFVLDFSENGGKKILTVGIKNSFLKEQLETKYSSLVDQSIKTSGFEDTEVMFVVSKEPQKETTPEVSAPLFSGVAQTYIGSYRKSDTLNPNHSFENFVVGASNNLAHMAFVQASQNLGSLYNPVYVYGPTGVGKTHLLQAFGNYVVSNVLDAKVLYVSAEKFTNDYIESLNNRTQQAFRQKYRGVDVLLVDDVQFFAGKESTQDEFFFTFNELALSGRQLVIAGDRHPNELTRIKDRLTSRFVGGMTADVGKADFELRVAILKSKCREKGVDLPEDVCQYIAKTCETGARELEGFLVQVLALFKLSGGTISLDDIRRATEKNAVKVEKTLNHGAIVEAVCRHFRVSVGDLCGPRRKASLVLPRQVLMYLLRHELGLSLDSIGELLGGRDHTTILYGVDKVEKVLAANQARRDEIARIRSAF